MPPYAVSRRRRKWNPIRRESVGNPIYICHDQVFMAPRYNDGHQELPIRMYSQAGRKCGKTGSGNSSPSANVSIFGVNAKAYAWEECQVRCQARHDQEEASKIVGFPYATARHGNVTKPLRSWCAIDSMSLSYRPTV